MKSKKSDVKNKINRSWRHSIKYNLSLIHNEEEAEFYDDKITKYDVKNIIYFEDKGWSYNNIVKKNNYFFN